jgi:hypothetical protein
VFTLEGPKAKSNRVFGEGRLNHDIIYPNLGESPDFWEMKGRMKSAMKARESGRANQNAQL